MGKVGVEGGVDLLGWKNEDGDHRTTGENLADEGSVVKESKISVEEENIHNDIW